MAISETLFTAILAMDSYNRGYNATVGIQDGGLPGTRIGNAELLTVAQPENYQAKGFFAQAYNWNGQTVISYRSTDNPSFLGPQSDVWYGWTIGGGWLPNTQAGLAIDFYESTLKKIGAEGC